MNERTGGSVNKVLSGIAVVGALGVAAAYPAVGASRFWTNWVLWFVFLAAIGLGCMFVVALEHTVESVWSVPLRRIPERLSGIAVWFLLPMGLVALLSIPVIFPWTWSSASGIPMIVKKEAWLNTPFFVIRVLVCLALWVFSYRMLVTGSFKQDETRDPMFTVKARWFSRIFLIIFALTLTTVGFDWISSLEPTWYSDMFGVYIFAGTFLAGLAATTLGAVYLLRRGRLKGITEDHLYNLGGYMFAFTVFWGYIGFAQYMLQWYGNMPEEVFWFKQRFTGGWLAVSIVLGVGHFFLPFLALISRSAKRNLTRLRWVALCILFFEFLDLYWMIFPTLGKGVVLGWPELAFAVFFISLVVLWSRKAMTKGADMPVGDPFLKEGMEFHL
jgi:hypothetical protein